MKTVFLLAVILLLSTECFAQLEENTISLLEQQAASLQEETMEDEDDSFLTQLDNFRKRPLNLNTASASDLKELVVLNDLQVGHFLRYRRLFGDLLDIYELQAVPGWGTGIIQKILPFVTVRETKSLTETMNERWSDGSHTLLLRTSGILEEAAGYHKTQGTGNYFLGSAARLLVRYNYNYSHLLQWGFTADKDAGEQFFRGSQKAGFDFYSFHCYLSRIGCIKALALGDFTVNMGQGLIQWQSLAFKKSAEISSIKRQSSAIRPYTATGENNFHRGAAITLQKGNWEATFFLSFRKLSGNFSKESPADEGHISSFLTSGYHRTPAEIQDRNNLRQITSGAVVRYTGANWNIAVNTVQYKLSIPFQKKDEPYNLFAPNGKIFNNLSLDYSYTCKNVHFFGELATDKNLHKAFLSGVLASLSPGVDLSLLYRSIDKRYQCFFANAFTENSIPVNEEGFYAGLSISPSEFVKISGYTDMYHFPWLKYRVDAPSVGREYLLKISYHPNKQVELYGQISKAFRQQNTVVPDMVTSPQETVTRRNWLINYSMAINRSFTVRSRVETVLYNKGLATEEQGFLVFTDLLFKPELKQWSGNFRLCYFETTGYNSRLYAFENSVLYNFSIPAFFDRGYRYYVNLHLDLSSLTRKLLPAVKTECWFRAAQTRYIQKNEIGSGLDRIKGNVKTDLTFQLMIKV